MQNPPALQRVVESKLIWTCAFPYRCDDKNNKKCINQYKERTLTLCTDNLNNGSVLFELLCWYSSLRGAPTWRLHTQLFQFVLNVSPSISHMKNSPDLNLGEAICILILFHFPDSGKISTCIHFHNDMTVTACTTKPQCDDCPLITYGHFGSDIKTCIKEQPRRNTYN